LLPEEYGLLGCDTMLSGRNIPTIMKGPAVPIFTEEEWKIWIWVHMDQKKEWT
jgi:hypothetical protein